MIDKMIQMMIPAKPGGKSLVFCYHCVSSLKDTLVPSTTIHTEEFLQDLKLLQYYGASFINGAQLADYYARKILLPTRSVLITFDDGFRNYMTEILPLLEAFQIPSIIFIATDYIDTEQPYSFVGWTKNSLNTVADHGSIHSEFQSLTSNEVLHLSYHPLVEIGAHTCSHPYLTRISEKKALSEIMESKKKLEFIIGRKIRFFAYPHGDYSDRIAAYVARNFELGFTINRGINKAQTDPHTLRRVSLKRKTSINQIRQACVGFYDLIRFFDSLRGR